MKTNSISIIGNLGNNPETVEMKGDRQLTKFSIAHKLPNSEKVEWFSVNCWNAELAERVLNELEKGSRIRVTGSLRVNRYQKKNGGGEEFRLVINLESFEFVPYEEAA